MERNLRQFKQAVKVFDTSISDELINNCVTIWIEYGKFCRSRSKFSNAQKVYLKALDTLSSADDKEAIWIEFLAAIQEKEKEKDRVCNVNSVDELKKAVLGPDGNLASGSLSGRKRFRGESSESTATNSSRENSVERPIKSGNSVNDDLRPTKIPHLASSQFSSSNNALTTSLPETTEVSSSSYTGSVNTLLDHDLTNMSLEMIVQNRPPSLFESGIIIPPKTSSSPTSLPFIPSNTPKDKLVGEQKYLPQMNLDTYFPLGINYDPQLDLNTLNGSTLTPQILEGLKHVLANEAIFDILKSLHTLSVITDDNEEKKYHQLKIEETDAINIFLQKYNVINTSAIPPQYQNEFEALCKSFELKFKHFHVQLNQTLLQILHSQQDVLQTMGVPYVVPSRDPAVVDYQKAILATLFSNFYLFRKNFQNN